MAVEWNDAEREARMDGRFALVGQRDGRGSRHVVWVSRSSTTAAYPPADICDERTWVSFEPLFTAREVAAREAQAAAKALREAADAYRPGVVDRGYMARYLRDRAARIERGES